MTSLAEQWTAQLADRRHGASGEPAWVNELREAGAAAFRKYGLPHRKVEEWKYTSLKLLEARSHSILPPTPAEISERAAKELWPDALLGGDLPAIRMLNGQADVESLPAGGQIAAVPLSEAFCYPERESWVREGLEGLEIDGPSRAFAALNTSMLGAGLLIQVPAGIDAGPVLLRWAFDEAPPATLFHSRVLVRLEEGATLQLIEQFESGRKHAHGLNLVCHANLGRGARLSHVRLQQERDDAALITRTECDLNENSAYDAFGFDWGGGLVRHDIVVRLNGKGAAAGVNGAFVLNGSQHLDNHVFVDHVVGDCSSDQFFRGVLGGHSRGVFNGKARIQAGADGSSVLQSNANLLLSPLAEMDTKPELEIYADEVQARHGATVGQLDEDAVFYMRTRGLSDEEARGMLTSAFCRAVLERMQDTGVSFKEEISSRMAGALESLVGAACGRDGRDASVAPTSGV